MNDKMSELIEDARPKRRFVTKETKDAFVAEWVGLLADGEGSTPMQALAIGLMQAMERIAELEATLKQAGP